MKKLSYMLSLVLSAVILLSNFSQAQDGRKWSPQAKGTVIGAGTGAAAGAIIHKRNRVLGGVVGGVVGGAAGYAIGKRKDNKNKEAARIAAANRAAANRAAANRAAARRVAVAKKSAEPSRANNGAQVVLASQQQPAGVYNTAYMAAPNGYMVPAGYMANQTAVVYDAYGNPISRTIPAGYLPNPAYGNPNQPYGNFEYRRKSW